MSARLIVNSTLGPGIATMTSATSAKLRLPFPLTAFVTSSDSQREPL